MDLFLLALAGILINQPPQETDDADIWWQDEIETARKENKYGND